MLTISPPDKGEHIPRLADGVRLLGAYDSQGLTKPKYIAQRSDGQVVLLSELLYLTAQNLDGSPLDLVADHVSTQGDRAVNAEEVSYLATTKLAPLGLVALQEDLAEAPQAAPKAAPILAMAGRGFLPVRAVRAGAWCLRPLFWAPVMVACLAGFVGADVWAFLTQPVLVSLGLMLLHPAYALGALGLLASATLFHEFGHATACRYGGGKPGAIGAGVYLMFPAFYTDVTDSYRLSRRARLRVDLGGVYFNAVWIVAAAIAYHFASYPPLLVILAFSNLTIIQQLLPVVRLDGYWVLSDLVGVPDLFARIKPALKSVIHRKGQGDLTRKALVIVSAWVAIIVPLLLVSTVLLLTRMPGFIAKTYISLRSYFRAAQGDFSHQQWSALVLAGFMMMFLLLPTVGLGIMAVRSTKAVGGLVSSRLPRRYKPQHMAPEDAFDPSETTAYLLSYLQERPPHIRLKSMKQYDPTADAWWVKRSPTAPMWPKKKRRLEWWECDGPEPPWDGRS
jgi:putative peptide zinc metalloprotease protein